ncbi:thiamine phosphate synthase [Citricoccus muralis]|uniref:thiamine phosphate synthase n=1 Tax=Citricoccus muralis TaxID=169134 RepID=UPI000E24EC20
MWPGPCWNPADSGHVYTLVCDEPDYFCTGPLWETPTKPGRSATGPGFVRDVSGLMAGSAAAGTPWFAIGGIDVDRLPEVLNAGASRIVVVRAITKAPDPGVAARQLRGLIRD